MNTVECHSNQGDMVLFLTAKNLVFMQVYA